MRSILLLLTLLPGVSLPIQDPSGATGGAGEGRSVREHHLRRWQQMSDEQKARMRALHEKWKTLPPEERQRIQENCRRFRHLSPDKRQDLRRRMESMNPERVRAMSEVASAFSRFAQAESLPDTFPRMFFFGWMHRAKPGEEERIRALDDAARTEAFRALLSEFRAAALQRREEHLQKHACITAEELQTLRDAPPSEFWTRASALRERCPERHRRRPERRGPPPFRPQ